MDNLSIPLTEDEMNKLDRFLTERVDEDEVLENANEGVLDICELDGFFTAIVSGPELVPPSRWLPMIWGDFEPDWDSDGDLSDMMTLLIRHMNDIAATLSQRPEDFRPLFFEQKMGGNYYTVVDEWCQGYARGTVLHAEEWKSAGEELQNLLNPIYKFVGPEAWEELDRLSGSEVDNLQQLIKPAVLNIYDWWLIHRHQSSVNRNEPCSCGSGKNYENCCLH